jgi:tetratricopeptide (TPR) repeat protein
VVGVLAAGVALWLGRGLWLWVATPAPPVIASPDMDPLVAQAIEAARDRIRWAPLSGSAWGELGMVLRAHQIEGGVELCFRQAERLAPGDPRWPYLLALTLLANGPDPAPALGHLERAAELAGEEPAPRLRLGEVLLDQGRADEAEGHFRQVLAADLANPRAHLGLARVAHQRGDWRQSLDHLTKSASGAPNVKATRALLAEVYNRLGDRAAAEQQLRRLATLPDDGDWLDPYVEQVLRRRVGVWAAVDQASSLLHRGRGDEAVAVLQDAAASQPDPQPAYLALGRLFLRLEQPAKAEPPLRRAVRLAPQALEARFELGIALYQHGKVGDAAESFREATRLKPDYALAHFNLGRCLDTLGDPEGAIQAYQAAVRYRPDCGPGHRSLATLLADKGRTAEALVHFHLAVQLDPSDQAAKKALQELQKGTAPSGEPGVAGKGQ